MSASYIEHQDTWLTNSGVSEDDKILVIATDEAQMFGDVKHVGKQGTVKDISYGILVKVGKAYQRVPFYCVIRAED